VLWKLANGTYQASNLTNLKEINGNLSVITDPSTFVSGAPNLSACYTAANASALSLILVSTARATINTINCTFEPLCATPDFASRMVLEFSATDWEGTLRINETIAPQTPFQCMSSQWECWAQKNWTDFITSEVWDNNGTATAACLAGTCIYLQPDSLGTNWGWSDANMSLVEDGCSLGVPSSLTLTDSSPSVDLNTSVWVIPNGVQCGGLFNNSTKLIRNITVTPDWCSTAVLLDSTTGDYIIRAPWPGTQVGLQACTVTITCDPVNSTFTCPNQVDNVFYWTDNAGMTTAEIVLASVISGVVVILFIAAVISLWPLIRAQERFLGFARVQ
jgi:hypothetical protein